MPADISVSVFICNCPDVEQHGNFRALQGRTKSRFTVARMANNTILNNTRINCVSRTHNCKPTFDPPCIFNLHKPFKSKIESYPTSKDDHSLLPNFKKQSHNIIDT